MSIYTRILATFLIAVTVAFAVDDAEPSPFQAGIEAYDQGDYETAKLKFIAALEMNETAAAHHNLGLTELQLERPAEAVWQLERALLMDPFNQGYHEKLNLVRKQLGLATGERQWRLLLSQLVSLNTWKITATISFWLLVAAMILPKLSEQIAGNHIKLLQLFSALTLALSLTAMWVNSTHLKTGIVLSAENTPLHAAPATAAPESGFARAGERARVLDRYNNFYQIRTEGYATGWISKNDFRFKQASTFELVILY